MPRVDAYLQRGCERGCSDIHLGSGLPPLVRVDGELIPLDQTPLPPGEPAEMVGEILSERHREELATRGATDLSYRSPSGRFRVSLSRANRGIKAVFRVIPETPRLLSDLGLPSVVQSLAGLNTGLILVTGGKGTGKSTTLAALIAEINRTRDLHIITLEDPIEFVHRSDRSLVVQREVGTHVESFSAGLRSALREDPDVILVGELRDSETISLAIEASETGHLVLGTLHTRGAYQTIHRIVDAYPTEAQAQIRHTLADSLKCVLSQDLLRVADGRGRRAVLEILVVTVAVAQLIRESRTFQIPQAMITGRRFGMQLMDQALLLLVRSGDLDPNEAYMRATDKREFLRFVTRPEIRGLADPTPASSGSA